MEKQACLGQNHKHPKPVRRGNHNTHLCRRWRQFCFPKSELVLGIIDIYISDKGALISPDKECCQLGIGYENAIHLFFGLSRKDAGDFFDINGE